MPGTRQGACLAAAFTLLIAPGTSGAQSGYSGAPFHEAPVALAQAAALDRLDAMARAVAAQPVTAAEGKSDAELAEEDDEEGGAVSDLALFRASLAAASPELAAELAAMVRALAGSAEAAESPTAAIEVIRLLEAARGSLPGVAADDPGFRAALMTSLLLDEGGVAESYEEAVEGDPVAYAAGWFMLQSVKALWSELQGQAAPAQGDNARAMLGLLDALFPAQTMPEALPFDPEQAEAPAQMLVGTLEVVADADLYPGRHLPGAVGLVRDIAAQGCEAIGAGDEDQGGERLLIASRYYEQTVADTLKVIAPAAGEAIREGLEAAADGDGAGACEALLHALDAGREALGA